MIQPVRGDAKPSRQKLQRLSKTTLQDQAYEELKDALIGGQFTPGDVLVIRQLAIEMGTSIMPVRDALQRLVAERALEMLPNRTVQVPLITRDAFDKLTEIRLRLEALATEEAALRVTGDLIAALREQNEAMMGALREEDAARALEANKSFHFTLYRASQSELLIAYIESLWLRIGPLLKTPWRMAEGYAVFDRAPDTHQLVIDALGRRDAKRAAAAIVKDISDAADWYRSHSNVFSGSDRE
ncbi:GntR family transcriptional regulator [Taklimakanibacter deserti]|uniref:GntR family transcriptional regulator n=1 Tax=Taklimakanibacter deserti TaxID=2267839 RepID=UPI0013C478AA